MLVLMSGAILLGACSSATVSKEPLVEGELRLLSAGVAFGGVVTTGVSYEVKITFKADSQPTIRRACFSWEGQGPYCYHVNPRYVYFGSPGTFSVMFTPTFFGSQRVECYAEYYQGTKLLRTNVIYFNVDVRY